MGRARTVLVVEDDDAIRDALRDALLADCRVICVSTLAAATKVLPAFLFDAVLLDLVLPGKHGEELLHQMATGAARSVPVVVLSASREASRIADAYRVPFVAKPFGLDVALAALDLAIEQDRRPRVGSRIA